MKRRAMGGVFGEIDKLLLRFEADKKRFKLAMKERLGATRVLRVQDVFYACRWKGTTYRALSVDALLEKLPKRGETSTPAAPAAEALPSV